ncbi:hypothetical protein [Mucilaginibacter sp. UYCu711]|uniref:hypothetical protein n=1 Tax=Mucilaginibacter sp. UYCu711 TaxID=3156339 RepID=UPI003D1AD622
MSDRDIIRGKLVTRKGEFIYEYFRFYNKTHHFDTYAFMIWDEKDASEKDKADFSLLIMDDGIRLKVIDLIMKDYEGNGIAPAIIMKAREIFGKPIVSSSNQKSSKSFNSETNWPEAIERVWKPLAERGCAVYDQLSDHYIIN